MTKAAKKQPKEEKKSAGKLVSRLQRLGETLARSCVPEILFLSTLILARYLNNIDFSYPAEVVGPIVLFGPLAAVVFYSYKLILKRVFAAHIASTGLLYLLYALQQHPISNGTALFLLPHRFETPATIALVRVLLLGVAWGLIGFGVAWLSARKQLQAIPLAKIMIFAILFLFVSEAGKVGLRLVQIWPELSYRYHYTAPKQDSSKITAKPNVYYLVFDRYGNEAQLQKNFDINNKQTYDFLASQGFVSRPDAYSNYPFTMSSITSTLAMQYHTELGAKFGKDSFQTGFPYRTIFNDPPAAELFKQNGYAYNQVSSWWDFSRVGIKADNNMTESFRLRVFGHAYYLSDLDRDILNKSIFSPLLKHGLGVGNKTVIKYDLDRNPQENLASQYAALKTIAANQNDGPQFTFAHLLIPHPPYVFKADGSNATWPGDANDEGADETVKYQNAVAYANVGMKDVISYIRQHDPGAAIIIQADEGPYPKQFRGPMSPAHYYDPLELPLDKMQQKFSILASYYMPDQPKEAVKQNITASVDPLRFVLSRYLGYDMPMLPDCHFATGNKFMVFGYTLVNDKLTGTAAPAACTQYK